MADWKELIEQIFADLRSKSPKNFDTTVYRDEPILKTAAQMKNFLPPEYREMRRLAAAPEAARRSAEWLFYSQAKHMEHFEDDCPFTGDFRRYFPTYQAMNDSQLRGYFSWRTRVRRGQVHPTALSFVFVYVYELLHGIGAATPAAGLRTLQQFADAYCEWEPSLDVYLAPWLRDYVVYYGLDAAYLPASSDLAFDEAVLTLQSGSGDMFGALNALSTYDLAGSKFGREHPEDVRAVTEEIFRELSAYYTAHRTQTLWEKLFGRVSAAPYQPFRSAVFYDHLRREDYTYTVNAIHRYRCQNGRWTCEKIWSGRDKSPELGAMMKEIDRLLREAYGFKAPLKAVEVPKYFRAMAEKIIAAFWADKQRREAAVVRVDLTRLAGIRRAADITRDRLLVEEEEEEPPLPPPPPNPEPTPPAELSDTEYRLLRALLRGEDYTALLRERGALLSVVADSINDTLFDRFGDTVILFEGDTPVLIDEYIDDLKGWMGL